VLASPKRDPIQATVHDDPGKTIRPDLTVDEANADDFDALILPGGVRNPDTLRLNVQGDRADQGFDRQGKPIGAICHGPWLLVEADLLRGRTATSWPSIRTDLRNAGANVVDEAAVTDGNIVTSRKPHDVSLVGDRQRLQSEADRSVGLVRRRAENGDVGQDLPRNGEFILREVAGHRLIGLLGIWTRNAEAHLMALAHECERLPIR
jgi:PfpI family intracellular protease